MGKFNLRADNNPPLALDASSRICANFINSFEASATVTNNVVIYGIATTNLAQIFDNIIGIKVGGVGIDWEAAGFPSTVTNNIYLDRSTTNPSITGILNSSTVDFPKQLHATAFDGVTQDPFAPTDFKPAAGGKLRLLSNLRTPQVAYGLNAVKRAGDRDMVGGVPLAA